MIKNARRIFILLGMLLLLFSVSLAAYNFYREIHAGKESEHIVEALHVRILQEEKLTEEKLIEEEPVETLPYYRYDPDYEMPTTEIDGETYIGVLSIPELGIELPVASEWSYAQLNISSCRYSGSAYSNDMVICAHNYRTHFGRLSSLSEGALVTFTDVDGNVFRYEVYDIELLKPDQTEEMKTYGDGLTLFTCTLGRETRITVRTILIESLSGEEIAS